MPLMVIGSTGDKQQTFTSSKPTESIASASMLAFTLKLPDPLDLQLISSSNDSPDLTSEET